MAITQVGPYRISFELRQNYGRRAFQAFDEIHKRQVLLTECPLDWPVEEVLQRLENEARSFILLKHPNIAQVFGFVRRDQVVYLVTELVDGPTLGQILQERRRMPVEMAIDLFRQIIAGLSTAHRSGLVHGELRPANIAVPTFGPIKI